MSSAHDSVLKYDTIHWTHCGNVREVMIEADSEAGRMITKIDELALGVKSA